MRWINRMLWLKDWFSLSTIVCCLQNNGDEDDDDEGYEGGEDKTWNNEDGDGGVDDTDDDLEGDEKKENGINQPTTTSRTSNTRKKKPSRRSHKRTTVANVDSKVNSVLPVQYKVTQAPLDLEYCKRKLRILQDKLNDLAKSVANINFNYGKPTNTNKPTCTRYRTESRVRHRYNVTNIWSSVNVINKEDITLVTQMTTKRMGVLTKIAEHWSGAISVAVYARKEELSLIVDSLKNHTLLLNRKNIEFHIVIEDGVSVFLVSLRKEESSAIYWALAEIPYWFRFN